MEESSSVLCSSWPEIRRDVGTEVENIFHFLVIVPTFMFCNFNFLKITDKINEQPPMTDSIFLLIRE